jgi:hypothetical protein
MKYLASIIVAIFLISCGNSQNSSQVAIDTNYSCADGGTSVTARIETAPYFASSRDRLQDIELSHTIFYATDIKTNTYYQVAVDNVFANDFNASSNQMPNSYQENFKVGKIASLCGLTYTNPTGIHWVHTNCNNPASGPTGHVIIDNKNYTNSTAYCYLWSN